MISKDGRESSRTIPAIVFCLLLTMTTPVTANGEKGRYSATTRVAMASYQICLAETGGLDLLTSGKEFIADAAQQAATSPLLDRFSNWHFYDAHHGTEHAMGHRLLGGEKSIHQLHGRRVDELVAALSALDTAGVYAATGRILHHLQDMVIPANVAPVYHHQVLDFTDSDPYTELTLWDSPRYIWQKAVCRVDEVDLTGLKTSIPALLTRTAERTRARVRAQITRDPDHPFAGQSWEAFWTLRKPEDENDYEDVIPGFAPWGYQGPDGFPELCRSDRELCESFFNAGYADTIDASVRALLMINAVLNTISQ